MNSSISFRKGYIIYGILFSLSAIGYLLAQLWCNNWEIDSDIILSMVFIIIMISLLISFLIFIRQKFINYTKFISNSLEEVQKGRYMKSYSDTISSKIQNKIDKIFTRIKIEINQVKIERDNIKTLISDISHQLKTPLSNISIYEQLLREKCEPNTNQYTLLNDMKVQVCKLDWLIESLIKISRLETGLITLNEKLTFIKPTLAKAISGIFIKAENKNIHISVNCSENTKVLHDTKWTSEAIFNILDNAVKYNRIGGSIDIEVCVYSIFTKINITDTGIGINNNEITDVFKRFYRSKDITDIEGVGIGLCLTRKIIQKQGGYIKTKSVLGKGTTFSVYLRND